LACETTTYPEWLLRGKEGIELHGCCSLLRFYLPVCHVHVSYFPERL